MSREIINISGVGWFESFLQCKSSLLARIPPKIVSKEIILSEKDWEFVNAKPIHDETQKEYTDSFPIE